MTRELKWRIVALQAMAVLVLGFSAGFLYYEASFANNFVRDQLVAQNIYFPDASQAVPGAGSRRVPEPAAVRRPAGRLR